MHSRSEDVFLGGWLPGHLHNALSPARALEKQTSPSRIHCVGISHHCNQDSMCINNKDFSLYFKNNLC